MNTESSEKIVVKVTAQQFEDMVRDFFKRIPVPTSEELYQALVPDGCRDTAELDEVRFPYGIWKYQFVSSDGIDLMVKYHGPDMKVRKDYPFANSSLYFTAQIICGEQLFFGFSKKSNKPITTKVGAEKAAKGIAPKDDDNQTYHIPLRDDVPSSGSRDQVISFKASQANDDIPDSFVLFEIFIILLTKTKNNLHNAGCFWFCSD